MKRLPFLVLAMFLTLWGTRSDFAEADTVWSDPILLNSNGATDEGDDRAPQIILDAGGRLHAVWYSRNDVDGAGSDADIFCATLTSTGWSDPVLLNTNGASDGGMTELPRLLRTVAAHCMLCGSLKRI